MASRPLLPNFGAALDFANASNSYLIPAEMQQLPEKKVGNMPTVDYPFWAAPNRPALSELLRHVVAHPDEAQAKGAQAAKDIAAKHTWRPCRANRLPTFGNADGRNQPTRRSAIYCALHKRCARI